MSIDGLGELGEKLRRATVEVTAGRRGYGSGIIVKPEGVIVTNAHVAALKPLGVRLWDGEQLPAELKVRDASRDLAVLQVSKSGLPAAKLANSDQLRVGERVIAIGNPMGFVGGLTTGVVRGMGVIAGLGARPWIQSDIRLAPGSSGGPLASTAGVVGINTMVAGRFGLAIPSNSVARLLQRGNSRALFGVAVRAATVRFHAKDHFGLLILEVVKNSPAETASLMIGDILVGADGRYFDGLDGFEKAIEGTGERLVRVNFLRGDRSNIRTVAVRLGMRTTAAA